MSLRERFARFWWHPTIDAMQAIMLRHVWAYTRSYDFTIAYEETGSWPPFRFVTHGRLPKGLRMNGTTGTLYGTPR